MPPKIMNPIKTLIVDDEQHGRNTLSRFLAKYCPDIEVIGTASSVDEAELQIRQHSPQLVFLDISMPEEDGFGLYSRLPGHSFYTIFVTAFEEYALRAIRHHALDYILKPVNINELVGAVDHARKTIAVNPSRNIEEVRQMLHRKPLAEKIALPLPDGFIYKDPKDIIRCEAVANYTSFHFSKGPSLLVCRNLGGYEDILEPYGFARVHHHHLVNIAHIEKYQRGRGGMLIMSDGAEVLVSQRKKEELLKRIDLSSSGISELRVG
jgi:two-component system LytT family response regulator